jgi:hypothetical protein
MNSKAILILLGACIVSSVALPGTLNAQPPIVQSAGPAALLRQAYITLSAGNHDYNGHRYYAMREVEAAANIMRFDLRGDGPGVERQRVSDNQLRDARAILEQARHELRGRARRHVSKAIGQIDAALRTR